MREVTTGLIGNISTQRRAKTGRAYIYSVRVALGEGRHLTSTQLFGRQVNFSYTGRMSGTNLLMTAGDETSLFLDGYPWKGGRPQGRDN